jgi:GTP cyclohydrolase IA
MQVNFQPAGAGPAESADQPPHSQCGMPISARIRERLAAAGRPYAANDAIGQWLQPGEAAALERELAARLAEVLDTLIIDRADPNAQATAARVARMYFREVFAGRYEPPPALADFPNGKRLDELYTLGPIRVRSACSHHLCPVIGDLWVGVIPSQRVIGLSKFSRLAQWVLARPQIQEEAIVQLADELESRIAPRGLGVVIRAVHSCMTWRGVREHDTSFTTSVMRGILREAPASRAEFFELIKAQGFSS